MRERHGHALCFELTEFDGEQTYTFDIYPFGIAEVNVCD
jgi:hypothetical protein